LRHRIATTPDHANLQSSVAENRRLRAVGVALGLLAGPTGMSRSFVRAWATVAPIMALVCFAFVQPMPEHTATPSVHQHAKQKADQVVVSGDQQVMAAPPFVDSVLTGKTFTPYLVLARPMLMPGTDTPESVPALTLAHLRSTAVEPPIRPG
jgi:hypothetical protein